MAKAIRPAPHASPWSSLQHPRLEERADISARRVGIPLAAIDDIGFDRQHRNPCVLEGTLDEETSGGRRLHAPRPEDKRTVNPVRARLVDEPFGGPGRVV